MMVEAFGVEAGVLGIAAIFSTCVECFDYIQIGRRFGKDFQSKRLTLNLLKLRLTRWGEAVNVFDDPQLGKLNASPAEVDLAKNTLYQFLMLFADSEKVSAKDRLTALQGSDLSVCSDAEMEPGFRALDNKMRALAAKRQKAASLVKLTTSVLYDRAHYAELIQHITKLLDQLEKVFPVSGVEMALAAEELQQINDPTDSANNPMLKALLDVSTNVDPIMKAIVSATISTRGTSYERITIRENAKLRTGHFVSLAWKEAAALPTGGGCVVFGTIEAGGTSRVHIGNTYAEKDDFWD